VKREIVYEPVAGGEQSANGVKKETAIPDDDADFGDQDTPGLQVKCEPQDSVTESGTRAPARTGDDDELDTKMDFSPSSSKHQPNTDQQLNKANLAKGANICVIL
jgi:hypothetical protein